MSVAVYSTFSPPRHLLLCFIAPGELTGFILYAGAHAELIHVCQTELPRFNRSCRSLSRARHIVSYFITSEDLSTKGAFWR